MGTKRQRGSKYDIPDKAHIVRDYGTMQDIAAKFASGGIKLLVILGGPGKGKGQIVKRAMDAAAPKSQDDFAAMLQRSLDNTLARLAPDGTPLTPQAPVNAGRGLYVKGHIKPIVFHIRAYQHRDAPICIDDADSFFANPHLRETTKHISETDQYKLLAHGTLANQLVEQGVPQEFYTTSPVCLIRNVWDSTDAITEAIESRAIIVYFDPTWHEAYRYIGTWFWDQAIFDYLLDKLPLLKTVDIRILKNAYDLKVSDIPGLPWQAEIDRHIADPSYLLMAEFLRRPFQRKEDRIDAWIAAVNASDPTASASRPTWHRKRKEVEALGAARPARILLSRTRPAHEERPFDSPVASGLNLETMRQTDGEDEQDDE